MNKLLIICKEYTPPLVKPDAQDLIKENWSYLVVSPTGFKLYRGSSYEEITMEEAQEKLKQVYDSVDYIVYQTKKVQYLSLFDNLIDTFQEYQNPELGAIYSDYYRSGQGVNIHTFVRNFSPDSFVMNPPPVMVVNKKYLPGLPLQVDQQLCMHLVNSCPLMHYPEATYILNE